MMNFMAATADRFNVAMRERPFTLSVRCYAVASAGVAIGSFSVSLISSSSIIAIPAAIIALMAAYVFGKVLVVAWRVYSQQLSQPRIEEQISKNNFNLIIKEDLIVAGLIKIKDCFLSCF